MIYVIPMQVMRFPKDISLPIISKMLGHADIKTIQRYAHLIDDPVNQVIDKTSDLLDKLVKAS